MKKELIDAVNNYLNIAYENTEIPENIHRVITAIRDWKSDETLFNCSVFEKIERDIFALRLGNKFYPHMKLSIRKEGDQLYFIVDTHDSLARIPETLPGFERFRRIKDQNRAMKKEIMNRLKTMDMYRTDTMDTQKKKNKRILVVDDEDFVRDILRKLLNALGFEVVAASGVDEAYQKVEEVKVDCCFLDIMMPGKSGYEFVDMLEAEDRRTFPVVFVTGMDETNVRLDLSDDIILKPFTLKVIKDKLASLGLLEVS